MDSCSSQGVVENVFYCIGLSILFINVTMLHALTRALEFDLLSVTYLNVNYGELPMQLRTLWETKMMVDLLLASFSMEG